MPVKQHSLLNQWPGRVVPMHLRRKPRSVMHLRPDAKVPRASVVLRSFLHHSIMKSWLYLIHFNYEGCFHPLAEDTVSGCRVRDGDQEAKVPIPCICRSRLKCTMALPLLRFMSCPKNERQRQGITGASWVSKEEV